MEEIQPEKSSKAEQILLKLEARGVQLNYKGFFPRVVTLSSGSGFAPSVRYWRPRLFGTNLDLQASAGISIRAYQQYTLQIGRILQFVPERFVGGSGSGGLSIFRGVRQSDKEFFLFADFSYRNFPQEDFFGLGPDSEREDRSDYRFESTSFDGVLGWQLNSKTVVAFRAGYLKADIGEGTDSNFPDVQETFDESEAPGLTDQPDFVRTNTVAVFDYRDVPGNPHHGGSIGFSHSYFDSRDANLDFHRFVIDVRQFISLGSPQRVLALRFLTSLDEAKDGHEVPFYLQEALGGSSTLRGFRKFRFRDVKSLLLSAEYRWEAAPGWELALFYDTGKVFSDSSDFNLEDLEDGWGIGTRFKLPTSTFMRMDVARSREGTRFYWTFSSSF